MIIVKPSAKLLHITSNAEQLIERCGRVCYKSEDRITDESAGQFIQMIMKRGHLSVIEHASATILFVCDRGVTHELVRHRLVSYSQESTRFCNYGKEKFGGEITVIQPPDLDKGKDILVGHISMTQQQVWEEATSVAETMYLHMIEGGISPQIARSVLPNCLKTEIATTANLREWGHILKLRTSSAAHPQIREIMFQAAELLKKECPNIFANV